jgi:hypothetical protein
MSEKPLKTDKPPIIEEVDKPPIIEEVEEPKEKKRLYWPWIVGGCVVFSIVGFVILCDIFFEVGKGFGKEIGKEIGKWSWGF